MNYQKTLKVASFMAVITIISKALGLFREILLASIYGANIELTAFLAASKIPLTLFDITLGSVVSAAFIPTYTKISHKEGTNVANKFANDYINLIIIITLVIAILGIIFVNPLIKFSLSGANDETIALATKLLTIMFPMIIFTGIAYTFVGILNCNQEFYITAVLSLISNAVVIIYLLCSDNIYGLSTMMLISWTLQVIVQIPYIRKLGFHYKLKLNILTDTIKNTVTLAIPILISSWAYPVSSLINMKMASYLDNGRAVSYMELANRLYIVISGIFAYVISNLSYPYLSKYANTEDDALFNDLIKIILKSITIIIVPIMIGLIVLGIPIVRLAYERGNFTAIDSTQTGRALISIGFGMLAFSYNEAINKIFYANQNARIPMITGIVGTTLTIVLCFILPNYFGIMGLGFAISIGTILTCILNFYKLNELYKALSHKEYIEFAKVIVIGVIMGITVYKIEQLLNSIILKVFIPTIIGAIEYFALAFIFRIEILIELLARLKKGRSYGK
ncbi:murein biosynthesis integral membrane protein MurJ [Candidatus Epulonipiscioides gigas]|nr:murein biosynthesis integral membrane protein MurJ [Epulopiscium sp. SCG-C07WGA-EpuloA2]